VSVKLTTRQVGDVTVIDAAGRITLGEGASAFREAIRDIAAKGNAKVLLNLSEITYIDSSGIGELVRTYMSVIKRDGEMKVVGLTDKAEEILKITKLYQVFQEFQDERSALQSFPHGGKSKAALEIVRPHKN